MYLFRNFNQSLVKKLVSIYKRSIPQSARNDISFNFYEIDFLVYESSDLGSCFKEKKNFLENQENRKNRPQQSKMIINIYNNTS